CSASASASGSATIEPVRLNRSAQLLRKSGRIWPQTGPEAPWMPSSPLASPVHRKPGMKRAGMKKLALMKETVRSLTAGSLQRVGGALGNFSGSCGGVSCDNCEVYTTNTDCAKPANTIACIDSTPLTKCDCYALTH